MALLDLPLAAVAEHGDDHPEDTLFSSGYDEVNHLLAINLGPNDVVYQCFFDKGPLHATHGEPHGAGQVPIDATENDDRAKMFGPSPVGVSLPRI